MARVRTGKKLSLDFDKYLSAKQNLIDDKQAHEVLIQNMINSGKLGTVKEQNKGAMDLLNRKYPLMETDTTSMAALRKAQTATLNTERPWIPIFSGQSKRLGDMQEYLTRRDVDAEKEVEKEELGTKRKDRYMRSFENSFSRVGINAAKKKRKSGMLSRFLDFSSWPSYGF